MEFNFLNFNKLAWEAPKHGEDYGYLPTDEHYDNIIKWLKSGVKRYSSRVNNISTCRVSIPGSKFDAIVEFNHDTKLISWTFREENTFQF